MKESYPDDIMLCFVQGFGDGETKYIKSNDYEECGTETSEASSNTRLARKRQQKKLRVHIESPESHVEDEVELRSKNSGEVSQSAEARSKKTQSLVTGKSLRLSSGDRFLDRMPEVKRSFSDRFSVITNASAKRQSKGPVTIRKTW